MNKVYVVAIKEFLLLRRDRAGLLILFLMPAVLVVLITLVQNNVMEMTGQSKTRMLVLDLDTGWFGPDLEEKLTEGNLDIISVDSGQYSEAWLAREVKAGHFQVGLVVAKETSIFLDAGIGPPGFSAAPAASQVKARTAAVRIVFDPAVMAGLRTGILAQVRMAVQSISLAVQMKALRDVLQQVPGALDRLDMFATPLLTVREDRQGSEQQVEYSPVQQNVPAWALFGVFFTAIPLAGSMVRERDSGIWIRLMSLPVSPLQLVCGKVLAYIAVCMVQFALIGLIGLYLFPSIGLPRFSPGEHPGAVSAVALCASFAACGLGMFLGTICSTYEQASAVGSTLVVASAAIGGVMVPVYAMPPLMQKISVISPLNWGLTAFQDLLIRNSSFGNILPELGILCIFFVCTAVLSWRMSVETAA